MFDEKQKIKCNAQFVRCEEAVWNKILLPLFDLEPVAKPTFVSAKENKQEETNNISELGGEDNAEAKEKEAPDYEERAEEMELDSTFSWRAPIEDCLAQLEKNTSMDVIKSNPKFKFE